jgi:hypothetical protein
MLIIRLVGWVGLSLPGKGPCDTDCRGLVVMRLCKFGCRVGNLLQTLDEFTPPPAAVTTSADAGPRCAESTR